MPVRLTEINGFWSGSQEDDFNPSIAGLDVTDDGCILLADGMNRNIKLFTANGQLLSVFALNNLPLDVTLINKTEAVVAARPMIPIISIDANNHIVLKRSITPKLDTTNIIDEIASYKDYLIFITMHSKGCHGSLAMMDMDGNMIWTRAKEIQVDDNSHLAIQHDNGGDDRVIFTSEFKGRIYIYIVAADTGEVLKAFKDEDTNLSGVAVDSLGRVYISNGCSIRVFSKSLDEERFITKCEDYGLICCNRKRGELIVMTGEMLDSIAIFRIELKSAEENNKVLI